MKTILTLVLLCALRCGAMDRWAALSMIESGDCDSCVGPSGEVSRYQITTSEWNRVSKCCVIVIMGKPLNPKSSEDSSEVAKYVAAERSLKFKKMFKRLPNDFEWYLLWHRPACVLGGRKPTVVERDRAQRFANLCERKP